MAKLWKEAASLIILARNLKNNYLMGHNYKILMFTRSDRTSFMAGSACFPGGTLDKADESKEWIKYFNECGVHENLLNKYFPNSGSQSPIFKTPNNDVIRREISLRIAAIRETFEEVGILLGRKKLDVSENMRQKFGEFYESFDRAKWQKIVHDDPDKFIDLCRSLHVLPDVWSLDEWSSWLTPASFSKKRFETAFFVVSLPEIPQHISEKEEVKDVYWNTAENFFEMHKNQELWLPPPQVYELNKLSFISSIEEITNFASAQSRKGILFLPVNYKCMDGMVSVYPGDDMYPSNSNDESKPIDLKMSVEEFRNSSKYLNRCEYTSFYDLSLHINIKLFEDSLTIPCNKL